jgi:hypothetical protein
MFKNAITLFEMRRFRSGSERARMTAIEDAMRLAERVGFEPTIRKAGFWALPVTICSEMTGFRP